MVNLFLAVAVYIVAIGLFCLLADRNSLPHGSPEWAALHVVHHAFVWPYHTIMIALFSRVPHLPPGGAEMGAALVIYFMLLAPSVLFLPMIIDALKKK